MKITALIYLLPWLIVNFVLNEALSAQPMQASEKGFHELKEYFDRLNGPDYNLLNGRQYEPLQAGNSHPYFNTDLYRPGSLVLNDETYEGVPINYDIHDQQVILQVHGWISGLNNQVVLNREMIDHFLLDGKVFRKMSFPETGTSFYQVLFSGEISCYLLWTKKLYRSSTSGNARNVYLKQSREIYVQKEDQVFQINNKSSFTSLFEKADRKEIRNFLRREKIRFGNASDEKLGELMHFCVGLIHRS